MKYIFSTFTPVLGRFFFTDPDSEKKSDPDPGKKTGSDTQYSNRAIVYSCFFYSIV